MEINDLSLRKLATVLGVSQPFLSQIRAGKRPMPEGLKTKIEALGAYHLLMGDKQTIYDPDRENRSILADSGVNTLVGVGRIELPTSCSQSVYVNAS